MSTSRASAQHPFDGTGRRSGNGRGESGPRSNGDIGRRNWHQPPPRDHGGVTTYALGEESGRPNRVTTYAYGEEMGRGRITTYALGEEAGHRGRVTTYALGEEGALKPRYRRWW